MSEQYAVEYAFRFTEERVEEYAWLVGDHNPVYHHDSHLERESVRYDDPVVPITMVTGVLGGAVGQLATHIGNHTDREVDAFLHHIDVETLSTTTAPVTLTVSASLDTTLVDAVCEMVEGGPTSLMLDADVVVFETAGGRIIADGTVKFLADFLD